MLYVSLVLLILPVMIYKTLRLDRGYFRSSMVVGCTLFLFSFVLSSLTQEGKYYQVFLSQAVGMGLGVGILFLPTNLVAIKHFRTGHAFVIVS